MGARRTKQQEAALRRAHRLGFVVEPLPLGGYLISENSPHRTPLMGTAFPYDASFYLSPNNAVDLSDRAKHEYTYEAPCPT